jgi:VIT1/CCC1 family predicted Fe2+/Mn2+ transporter
MNLKDVRIGGAEIGSERTEHVSSARHSAPIEDRPFTREEAIDHITAERKRISWLGEIREAIFGMQDGLLTSVALVSAIGTAVADTWLILLVGLASALAGTISMAVGEYISSRSQREIYEAEIADERQEVEERPAEARAEISALFQEEGVSEDDAEAIADRLRKYPKSWLKTMVEKELFLVLEEQAGAFQGALVMGGCYLVGSLLPVLPYLALKGSPALLVSIALTALALFAIGFGKALPAKQNPVRAGLEIMVLGTLSGLAGYLLGKIFPALLGAPAGLGD